MKLTEPLQASAKRPESGQSLIELAFVLPLLLLLCLGIIEIGRFAYISILVGNAARAGAAYGSQSLIRSADKSGITTAATNDFLSNGQSTLNVGSNDTCGCDNGGVLTSAACNGTTAGTCTAGHWIVTVNVTTSGTYNSILKYPGIPQSIALSDVASMREQEH
jgi:Flp pilus assembly protein TadG